MSRIHYAAFLAAAAVLPLLAQRPPAAELPAVPAAEEKPAPIPSETTSATDHELPLDGKTIRYKATAGTLLIDGDDEKPYGIVFYVAYTLNGVSDPRSRPVTFLYNGGPGSASLWLRMGSIGPVRVATASPEATGAAPYQVSPNQYSLLDKTDLVFVDAVGTGYSRPVGKATIKNFAGTDQDVQAFAKFIQRYVSLNHRWNSPKFLFGESYGTTRSAALVDALENGGMSFNGVILMSTILNYFALAPGSDAVYIGNLPSYAAIAWHYEKIAHKGRDEKAFLDEVRMFARGAYAEALAQGQNLPRALLSGTLIVLVLYVALNAVFLHTAPIDKLAGQIDVARISGTYIFGEFGGRIVGAMICIGLISSISAMMWIGPRVMMTMGEDIPALRVFARKSTQGAPAYAILFQLTAATLMLFTRSFEAVLDFIQFSLLFCSFFTVLGVIKLRITRPDLPRPYRAWGYPVTPVIFLLVTLFMMYYLVVDRPLQSFFGALIMVSGLLIYVVFRKKDDSGSATSSPTRPAGRT